MEGILPGACTLHVKVAWDKCTVAVAKEVKEVISKHLELEKYVLVFKGIKEGCIELIYQISHSVKSYILHIQCYCAWNITIKSSQYHCY